MQKPSTDNTDNPDYLHLRLLVAVRYGKLEEVQELIKKKVDVNERGNNNTALHYASVRGDTEIVNALIVANADVDLTCLSGGYTALHYAAEYGHAKAGEALINAGANIHARSIKGNTPLAIACFFGKEETIEVLLTKGADVNFVSTEGVFKDKTLIEIVASPTDTNLSEAQKIEMIETLFKYGAKIPSALLDNQEISDRIKEKLIELSHPDKIQARDEALLKNEELIEAYKKSILNGNLTLDPERPLTQTKFIPDPSDPKKPSILDNDIIGDVIVKAINSITKEELDAIKETDSKKFEKIQKSGFSTLIELSKIFDKDGKKIYNDIVIKTAINHPGDFNKFYKLFKQIMSTNKTIETIVESLQALKAIEESKKIEPSSPPEDSSKFDKTAPVLSIPPLLLALLSPEFKKELEAQDLRKSNLDKKAKEDSQVKLITHLADIIFSQIRNDRTSNMANTGDEDMGTSSSSFQVGASSSSQKASQGSGGVNSIKRTFPSLLESGGAKRGSDAFAVKREREGDTSHEHLREGSPAKASRTEGVGGGAGGLERSPSSSASLSGKRERGEEPAKSLAGEGSSKRTKPGEATGGAGGGAAGGFDRGFGKGDGGASGGGASRN